MTTSERYIVVYDTDLFEFEKIVVQRLCEGWECQGGVAVRSQEWERDGYRQEYTTYFQAMVKTSHSVNVEVTVDTKEALRQLNEIREKLER